MEFDVTIKSTEDFCDDLKLLDKNAMDTELGQVTDLEFGLAEVAAVATIVSGAIDLATLLHRALSARKQRLAKATRQVSPTARPPSHSDITIVVQTPLSQITLKLQGNETKDELLTLLSVIAGA